MLRKDSIGASRACGLLKQPDNQKPAREQKADPGTQCAASAAYEYHVDDGELPLHNSQPIILSP